MEKNSTLSCNDSVLQPCLRECTEEVEDKFFKHMKEQLWRVDSLLLVNAIFAGVIVGIGAYGHRYRHYGFSRYLLLGATALFLPIISSVLSSIGSTGGMFTVSIAELTAECDAPFLRPYLVMVSTLLVLISAINTSPIVATDDREDRSVHPPFEFLVQGFWISYLYVSTNTILFKEGGIIAYLLLTPLALIPSKMILKIYAFLKARKSFALGRNPRLIIGCMQQLREGIDQHSESPTADEEDANVLPPLVVMGEDYQQVEKQPHGYMFRNNLEALQEGGLVTLDRVWQLCDMFLIPMPQLKDICLSFALFKLLRCRVARYKLNDVICTKTLHFCRRVLIKEGEHERAFRMIADELSFLHEYYDSPLPISYSDIWLTISSMVISVLSICYCIFCGVQIILYCVSIPPSPSPNQMPVTPDRGYRPDLRSTIRCIYYCRQRFLSSYSKEKWFGPVYFLLVPTLLLLVLVIVAEVKDIASHVCSSWTKVILTGRCVRRATLQLSPVVPRWVGCLLRCRCNWLMRHWNDKMRQNSMLVLHPRQFHQLVFPRCILRLLDRRKNNVKVPTAVKVCIISALRSTSRSNGAGLSKGVASLRQSQVGESLLWACNSKGTSNTILVWHIATVILEVRHPLHQNDPPPPPPPRRTRQGGHRLSSTPDDKKTAATHLSRYCAYLVEFCPQLLPDDEAWSKGLYKEVKKDIERALAAGGGTGVSSMPPEAGHRRLIELLGARQNHVVLKDAAKLAEQLGELAAGGEETAWELLAGFWSEMVLYVAPSDNIKGHLEAVDRGGELITLLWAMLTHVGIVDRPESAAAPASSGY